MAVENPTGPNQSCCEPRQPPTRYFKVYHASLLLSCFFPHHRQLQLPSILARATDIHRIYSLANQHSFIYPVQRCLPRSFSSTLNLGSLSPQALKLSRPSCLTTWTRAMARMPRPTRLLHPPLACRLSRALSRAGFITLYATRPLCWTKRSSRPCPVRH